MNGDGKRRLPTWMLGVAGADQVRKSEGEKGVGINTGDGEVRKSVAVTSKKAVTGRPEKDDSAEIPEVNVSVLTRCRRKTKKQKTTAEEDQEIGDGEVSEKVTVTKKRDRKTRERGTKRPERTDNLQDGSSDEIETPSPGEEDGDLTMEDLLSIAHEYVRTDGRTEQQPSSSKEQKNGRRLIPAAVSVDKSRELPVALEIDKGASLRKESIAVENSTENLVSLDASRRTGDPTQDMLDLFLGPLLKKPPGDENKIKSIEEETFECEFRKQRQKNAVKEELPPLPKKKCSLKDKVAMFLDI